MAATTTAASAATVAMLLLTLAGWLVYDTATYVAAPHEDTSVHGLGYVAAPAGGSAWRSRPSS